VAKLKGPERLSDSGLPKKRDGKKNPRSDRLGLEKEIRKEKEILHQKKGSWLDAGLKECRWNMAAKSNVCRRAGKEGI